MRMKTCVGLLLPVVMTCAGADIVRNGKPCADIVVAENAGAETLSAAKDLQEHLRLISGATLKIVPPAKAGAATLVCVGESSCTRKAGYKMPKFASSGYDIWVKGSCIVLTGPVFSPAGTGTELEKGIHPHSAVKTPVSPSPAGDNGVMHAVSAFLEHLGVRFYAPGKAGTVVPHLADIRVGDFRETRRAAFSRREYLAGADPETLLWLAHLKTGSSLGRIGILPVAEVVKEGEKRHPEWAAQDDNGEKMLTDDGCVFPKFTESSLVLACAERAKKIFDADPKLEKLLIVLPALRGQGDAKELTGARVPGVYPQDAANNLTAAFASQVAELVAKTHPGKKIVWQGRTNGMPPRPAKFSPALETVPAGTAATFYATVKGRKNYPASLKRIAELFNTKGMQQREWWNEFSSPDTVRQGYYFMHALQEVRKAQKGLVSGLLMDAAVDSKTGKLAELPLMHFMYYLNSKLLWDPELDVDHEIDEYCRLWFGPAAREMKNFMLLWENIASRPAPRSISRIRCQLTKEEIPMLFETLDKAAAAAKKPPYGPRVAAVKKSIAGLENIFEKRTPAGPELAAEILPWNAKCDGDLAKYKNWISLPAAKGAPETRFALAFAEHRQRLFVAFRCGEPEMEKPAKKTAANDSCDVFAGDHVRIDFITSEKGVYTFACDANGSFFDGSSDPEELMANGCFSGWDQKSSRVFVRRGRGFRELEAVIDISRCGRAPGWYPDWGINITRVLEAAGRTEKFSLVKDAGKTPAKWRRLTLAKLDASGRKMNQGNSVSILMPGAVPESVYTVKRAKGTVDLASPWDGECWKDVPEMCLVWEEWSPGRSSGFRPDARAKIQHDGKYIYALYQVRDRCVRGDFKKDQGMVCLDSCMELFVRPDPDGPYYNFECSCIGTLLLYEIQVHGEDKIMSPMPSGELKKVGRFSTLPRDMKGEHSGPVTWRLGLRIPVEMFVRRTGIPEKLSGQVWGANVYKCADWTSLPCWLMWKENWTFHNPEGFGKFIFE